ncbi:hypothetical protein FNV62_06140 [Streptomyces sp. RLB3-17]|uniref:hypothetical protein n=1 Tax=unclassified Streptomyces TaxID=2593676 RepID=UPI00116249AA|nr:MULTISPECIES: hypothetical protein [unclassified Streptomyces]NMI55815.1 hypothetical protein [Streptomyces sp. RLA2-12]QDN55291.1 hypothetical protein FNV67_08045 [Streptomyces sp. S1D4-20]QDN65470.1 hypothetical protein FNV66_07645 [Streptomyces sp. S1D4-14]QDN75820.1 hypothetical protein FNV64_09710 [Streptomyces sp. S1A1-7]QDN85475.1 hypothetical protein FNV61_07325 [Streptomyces sp. RLB3-6]
MSLVVTSQHREADLWPVWAALAFGLTCGAGIVFALGAQQWRALPEAERRSRREAAVIVGTVVLGAALYGAVAASSNDRPGAWRGSLLVGTALVGATPMVCVAYAVWKATRSDRSDVAAGELTEWLLARRRTMRALVASLGALVALSTLALGAVVRLEAELVKAHALASTDATPFEYVLVFGGAGTLLVAIVYAPAAIGLRHQAHHLTERLFTLTGVDEPAALLERTEQRARFEQLLGAEAGPFADLQAGIVVLTPLLASAVAVWLPH